MDIFDDKVTLSLNIKTFNESLSKKEKEKSEKEIVKSIKMLILEDFEKNISIIEKDFNNYIKNMKYINRSDYVEKYFTFCKNNTLYIFRRLETICGKYNKILGDISKKSLYDLIYFYSNLILNLQQIKNN